MPNFSTPTSTRDPEKATFFPSSPSSSSTLTRKLMPLAYCLTFSFIPFIIFFLFYNPTDSHSPSTWFTNNPRDSSIRRSKVLRFPFSVGKNDEFSQETNTSFSRENSQANYGVSEKMNSLSNGSYEPSFSRESDGVSQKTNSSLNGKTKSFENQEMGLNGLAKGASENSHVTFSRENDGVSEKMNNPSNGTYGGNQIKNSENQVVDSNGVKETKMLPNQTALLNKQSDGTSGVSMTEERKENWAHLMSHCDVFDGSWVKDDSYPIYAAGSCPYIDEPFDCFCNGRGDNGYERFRWKPKGCNIPRLNGKDLLELLRGKRLVYVGDSLNRNMWESMVCMLRNSVEDKSKVFEASGRQEFRTENSYSFLFADYNCSVEFFRSTFLVQEWEMPDDNGSKKETLRLDLVERSSDIYKSADILVFNTGHWWTHEKTSLGKGYYQEGSHVYGELDVVEAFRKAMTTWARWIDASINPTKTLVFFRGYSASHFSGGQWNSGGQCDSETEPIKNEAYLTEYLPIMSMLETVVKGMKTPVFYLNVTKMTDFRKDAHPSIYRKKNLTEEERRAPLRYQDCSHWCLPGVPDTWNELLYALVKYNQKQRQQQQQQKRP